MGCRQNSAGLSTTADGWWNDPTVTKRHVLPVREDGSIVLPEAILSILEMEVGGNITLLERENGVLEITTARHTTRRVQALVRPYIPEGGGSMVEEFLAERRAEAAREEAEDTWPVSGGSSRERE